MGKVASAKQNAGGGISFEDKVNAFYLACMLTEVPPFGSELGLIHRIDFQVRADQNVFDDVRLTLIVGNRINKLHLSIKSNQQISKNGIPAEINRLLWEQFLQVNGLVFDPDTDLMGLVQAPAPLKIANDLRSILQQSREQMPQDLAARNQVDRYNSKQKRQLLQSFACPADLREQFGLAENSYEAAACFYYQEHNFEQEDSTSEQRLLELCQKALINPDLQQAVSLLETLCHLPRKWAALSATVDKAKLAWELMDKYALVEFPSYKNDWSQLQKNTQGKLSVIQDKIGNRLEFSRTAILEQLKKRHGNLCFLTGVSGAGKTALAKHLAQSVQQESAVVWLDSYDLEQNSIRAQLNLHHNLEEVISVGANKFVYCIIDGVDKLSDFGLNILAAILNACLNPDIASLKFILPCPVSSMEPLQQNLLRRNVPFGDKEEIILSELADQDFDELAKHFPDIINLLLDDKFKRLINNLKLLDKVVGHLDRLNETNISITETGIINIIWHEEIEKTVNGLTKGLFMKALAEHQADSLLNWITITKFDIGMIEAGHQLVETGFLVFRDERFSFNHDLYGDWALFKLLRSNAENIDQFFKTKVISSGLWARAIRLFGLSLFDHERGSEHWRINFNKFDGNESNNVLVQDLLLESLYSSGDAFHVLEEHKALFFAEDNRLLNRMLSVFLIKATTVNPAVIEITKQLNIDTALAVDIDRLPNFIYWTDVIRFLDKNRSVIDQGNYLNIAKITGIWLKHTPMQMPFRKECAEIALYIAQMVKQRKFRAVYGEKSPDKDIYEYMMYGLTDIPTEIIPFVLQLSGRGLSNTSAHEGEAHWPDGPYLEANDDFRNLCLSANVLDPLYILDPDKAVETILALLIIQPDRDRHFGASHNDNLYIYKDYRSSTVFYLRGPFYRFLKHNPEKAIVLICKFADFCVARRTDDLKARPTYPLELDGTIKRFTGDYSFFLWYAQQGSPPDLLVCALMALQQYLHELKDKPEEVTKIVHLALKQTNSLPVVGVLLAAAKEQAFFFRSHLHGFIGDDDLYYLDHRSRDSFNLRFSYDFPAGWNTQAKEWQDWQRNLLPIKDAVLNEFLRHASLQKDFELIVPQWQKKLQTIEESGQAHVYLKRLIPQFVITNYKISCHQGEIEKISYHEPQDVTISLQKSYESDMGWLDESNLPFNCYHRIEKGTLLTDNEAEIYQDKFRNYLKKISVFKKKKKNQRPDLSKMLPYPYVQTMAVAALLLVSKPVWIEKHPEYYDEIEGFAFTLMEAQLAKRSKIDPYAIHYDWFGFLPFIATVIYQVSPENQQSRKLLAWAAIGFNPAVTTATIKKLLQEYTLDFNTVRQVINLLLKWLGYKDEPEERNESDKERKFKLCISEFETSFISSEETPWDDYRGPEVRMHKSRSYRGYQEDNDENYFRAPGLNTFWLKEILLNLPALGAARSTAERTSVINFWEQAIKQVIYELGDINETSTRVDQYPNEFSIAILRNLPGFLLALSPEDRPERFWEPLLNYGFIADEHLEIFFSSFYLYHIADQNKQSLLADYFKSFYEFVKSCPTWQNNKIENYHEFRLSLFGMSKFTPSFWADDYSCYTSLVKKEFIEWFSQQKFNPPAVMAVLKFITTLSGRFMVVQGIILLNAFFKLLKTSQDSPAKGTSIFVGLPEHNNQLGLTLYQLWEKQYPELIHNVEAMNNFSLLVQYLVSIKNSLGIEIQSKMMIQ